MNTKKLHNKIEKPDGFFIKVNLLENRYVTDGVIWAVDETIFNAETKLFIVVSLKTRAILGYIQSANCKCEELIIELYKKILDEYKFASKPSIVHSDMEQAYHSNAVREFLKSHGTYISLTEGKKNQNQVSESINNRIKYLVTERMIEDTNSVAYRAFRKTLPDSLRSIRKKSQKCQDVDYRKHLFDSRFFKNKRKEVIEEAILKYNQSDFAHGIDRETAEYLDTFVAGRTIDNTRLVRSDSILAQTVKDDSRSSIKEVKLKISEILSSDLESDQKMGELISIVIQQQDTSGELMKQGFIGLALQNKKQQDKLDKLYKELLIVTEELAERKKQDLLILEKKERRKKRKRLPKRDPITNEIYSYLIEKVDKEYRETYLGARLRVALALLVCTGIRISELLPLKMSQLETLTAHNFIAIDRVKNGPASHKAQLTKTGEGIIKKRAKDFEILWYYKDKDSYIFTAQHGKKPLNRVSFSRVINLFLLEASKELPGQPNLKSHSFRYGFITEIWRDKKDIEFVRQAIGHAKVDTTSSYVQDLSDEERGKIMSQIGSKKDLPST